MVSFWVGPRASLDGEEKKSCPYQDLNSNPSAIQPAASCYTDCVVPAQVMIYLHLQEEVRGLISDHVNMLILI
jgi:hypothetical protein